MFVAPSAEKRQLPRQAARRTEEWFALRTLPRRKDYTPELSTSPGSGKLAILRSISCTRSLSSLISLR